MGLNHSPKIVTNGLVFAYDMSNIKKSWKGRPVTNQFTLPTVDVNGFGVQSSNFTRVRTGNYGGYEIQLSDYVWRYNISVNDCPYHGWDIPTTIGDVVTFSFDYYVDPSTKNYPIINYLANFENAGSGVSGGYGDPTPSIKGVWKRAYFSSTATSTGNSRCLLYPGSCGGRLGDSGFILYKNPQVEFNAPGGVSTPFAAGTRLSTQALIDLTNANTITADSLTYASDGTFSFNGSSNYITVLASSNWAFGRNGTIEQWVYVSGNSGTNNRFWCTANTASGIDAYLNGASYNLGFHGGVVTTSTAIPTNQWVHLVVTYTAGTIAVYFNGVSQSLAGTTTGYNITNAGTLYIGQYAGGGNYYLNGKIASTKIYSKGLTSSEVNSNFNALRRRYGV